MSEAIIQPAIPSPKKTGGQFTPGHQRYGGKGKGSAAKARKLAEEMNCQPMGFLFEIILSETMYETVLGPDGKKQRVEVPITITMKTDAVKAVLPYLYPRLSATATQTSGADGGPVQVSTFDITKLLQDPEASEAAQKLAFAMNRGELSEGGAVIDGTAQVTDVPAAERKALPAAPRNPLADLSAITRAIGANNSCEPRTKPKRDQNTSPWPPTSAWNATAQEYAIKPCARASIGISSEL